MVEIKDIHANGGNINLTYLTNGLTVPWLVKNTENMTPQEIIELGYKDIKPHVTQDCEARGVKNPDHKLPLVEDSILRIELLGITSYNMIEGQQEIKHELRCAAHTLFGKVIDIKNNTNYTITEVSGITIDGNILTINPKTNCNIEVTANYENFINKDGFSVSYKTQKEIDEEIAKQKATEEEAKKASLEQKKISKVQELQNACNQDILSGFNCHIKEEDRFFGSDSEDQINLISQLTLFSIDLTLTPVIWKCKGMQGLVDTYTKDEFLQICNAFDVAKRGKIERFWTLKQSALTSTTLEDLEKIVW